MISSVATFLYVHRINSQYNSMVIEKIIHTIVSDKFNDDKLEVCLTIWVFYYFSYCERGCCTCCKILLEKSKHMKTPTKEKKERSRKPTVSM